MLIISGFLIVDTADRDAYLSDCITVVEQARRSAGCLDFTISADTVDPGRLNIY